MNIIFNNKDNFNFLQSISIYKTVVGSSMYKFNDMYSDIDYLYILALPNEIQNNFFRTHHQLQYKINNEDHLFVFLDTFLKNMFNGDSTINFEVFQELQEGTLLDWLIPYKDKFFVYIILKAYLGFGKRDIKYFPKNNDLRNKRKKLKHIYRSFISAKMIFNKDFKISYLKDDIKFNQIDKIENDIVFQKELINLKTEISNLRIIVNKSMDNNAFDYFISKDIQIQIITDFNNFLKNKEYIKIFTKSYSNNWKSIMNYYYEVNENGLNY